MRRLLPASRESAAPERRRRHSSFDDYGPESPSSARDGEGNARDTNPSLRSPEPVFAVDPGVGRTLDDLERHSGSAATEGEPGSPRHQGHTDVDHRERKAALMKRLCVEGRRTGSPEVQVAILTERIANLTDHFKTHARTTIRAAACSKWSRSAVVARLCQEERRSAIQDR